MKKALTLLWAPVIAAELVAALDSHHPMLMCMQAWSSAVGGAEVSDFGRQTRFVTCAQKHEKPFVHYDN